MDPKGPEMVAKALMWLLRLLGGCLGPQIVTKALRWLLRFSNGS